MDISLRSALTAAVTAFTASAIVLAPALTPTPPQPQPMATTSWRPVQLTAAVTSGLDTLTDAEKAVVEQVAPGVLSLAPPALPAPPGAPAQQNFVSNVIDGVYRVSRYWANYVSMSLGPWLIGWIPFGYLINDQIYIWYPTFVLPVVDSFVYQFLIPVVNAPLNLNTWIDGLGAIANTAIDGAVSGVRQEIDYFLSLNWLPFPVPPLPPLPFAAPASTLDAVVPTGSLLGPVGGAIADPSQLLAAAGRLITTGEDWLTTFVGNNIVAATNGALPDAADPMVIDGGAAVDFGLDHLNHVTGPVDTTEGHIIAPQSVGPPPVADGDLPAGTTGPGTDTSTPEDVGAKEPRATLRSAIKSELAAKKAAVKAAAGAEKPQAKPVGRPSGTVARNLGQELKKAVKNVQQAGKAIGAAVSGKSMKDDPKNEDAKSAE